MALGQKQWNWFALRKNWKRLSKTKQEEKKTNENQNENVKTERQRKLENLYVCVDMSGWSIVEYVHLLPFALHAFGKLKTNT